MMTSAIWHIQLFGVVTARSDDRTVSSFRTQQTARLLACLASRPERMFRREEIIEMLWPDCEPATARNRLSVALSALRRDFGDEIIVPSSSAGRYHIQLNKYMFTTDAALFDSILRRINPDSPPVLQIEDYTRALSIYQGEFLTGLDDEWTWGERRRIAERYLAGVRCVSRLLVAEARHDEALEQVRAALKYEPLSEDLHRTLIQLLCGLGRRSEALSEHAGLVDRLQREFGIAPSGKTAEVVDRLLFGKGVSRSSESTRQVIASIPQPMAASVRRADAEPVFGRDQSVYEISAQLRSADTRLITLTGIGGIGKSRLASAVLNALADPFGQNRILVPLAEISDAKHLELSILRTLKLPSDSRTNIHNHVVDALKGRTVLLVLDNLEQILPDAARILGSLLIDLPELKCLVTSRQRLNISLEHEYPVSPLQTPALFGSPHRLVEFPSVQLFLHRAALASRGFDISSENAGDLAAICHHLEGLPLAIEMAAAWTRVLSPKEILERLSPRLDILISRNVDAADRHVSIRHTLNSSYRQMPSSLQTLFNRLSVFRGGWSAAAAEAISGRAAGCGAATLLDLMELKDRSLVTSIEDKEPIRLTFLELVREYAAERLNDSGEEEDTHEAHARFFLNMAEKAAPRLRGEDSARWLDVLDIDLENLRVALKWTMNGGIADIGVRLCASLWQFWLLRGYLDEGIEWLQVARQHFSDVSPALRARVNLGLGNLHTTAGNHGRALEVLNDAIDDYRMACDDSGIAEAENALGNLAFVQGDWIAAQGRYEAGLMIAVQLGSARLESGLLANLASVAARIGDTETAMDRYERCILVLRISADSHTLATVLANSVATLFRLNDYDRAETRLNECIKISLKDGYPRVLAHGLEGIATLQMKRSRWRDSAIMFAAAANVRERIHAPLPQSHRLSYASDYQTIRTAIGEPGFRNAWEYGSQMSDEAAALYSTGEPTLISA